MEAALLRLLGFAMARAGLARKRQRVTLLTIDGADVIAGCVRRDAQATAAVCKHAIRKFWKDLANRGLTLEEITAHVDALACILKTATSCNCAKVTDLRIDPASDPAGMARALASSIGTPVAGLRGGLEHADHTLQSLFAALLSAGDPLAPCLDAAAAVVAEIAANVEPETCTEGSRLLAKLQLQLSQDTGISMQLLNSIVEAQVRLGSPQQATMHTLVDRVVVALEMLADITLLADRAGDDDLLEAELIRIAQTVREGNLGPASCDLTAVSRRIENAPGVDQRIALDLKGVAFVPLMLSVRARLAGLYGEPRESARLFERAVRLWPREDRIPRWRLKIAQARQLADLGRLPGSRIGVLCEAAQVYASAGGLISEQDCPVPWGEANLELGLLLLHIGDRECRPERYLAAALHFKPAIDVFTRERMLDGWARAQIGLGHALRAQASFQGDVVVAREAAFAYRAALGILTEDGAPDLWHETRCALGEVLVRIAEEAGDIDALQSAIDILMPYSRGDAAHLGETSRSLAEIATGRAMLLLVDSEQAQEVDRQSGADSDDIIAIKDAIELIGNALSREHSSLTSLDRAHALTTFGLAQTLLYERSGDLAPLEQAIQSKEEACDLYEHIDNPIAADDLRLEIEAIQSVLEKHTQDFGVEEETPTGMSPTRSDKLARADATDDTPADVFRMAGSAVA